jgi:geranylgeranylglycerol-phosphate geranylgeranyltransferase
MIKEENIFHNFLKMIKNPFIFLSQWRSLPVYELVSYVLMFSSISILSHGIGFYDRNDVLTILFTVLSLYSGFFAALIWNDITDADIDAIVHPDRPIPSLKISSKNFFLIALFFSALTFLFSFLVNLYFFIAVLILAIFVAVHNKYLKRFISLPAYSEIVTPLQWCMVPVLGFLSFQRINFIVTLLFVLFTYFSVSSHDILQGIHDYNGDKKKGVQTYCNSFGVFKAIIVSLLWLIISGMFGILIYIFTVLDIIFLVLFFFIWIYTFLQYISLFHLETKNIGKESILTSRIVYNYYLFFYDIVFFDIIIQLIFFN